MIVLAAFPAKMTAQSAPERVLFLSGVHTLAGHVYKPAGKGPFPAVVYNQASMNTVPAKAKPFETLAHMFTSKGWAFFVPGRHQLGPVKENRDQKPGPDELLFREHDKQAANLTGAVAWLKSESYVDSRRVVVIGESAGAVSTLFAADKNMGVCAMVLFAPGTQVLKNESFKLKMRLATLNAKAPIFLMQTQNDYNLLPIDILGLELEKKGGVDRFKVYPPHGTLPSHAQKFPSEGYAVWQTDFFSFVTDVIEASTVAHKAAN